MNITHLHVHFCPPNKCVRVCQINAQINAQNHLPRFSGHHKTALHNTRRVEGGISETCWMRKYEKHMEKSEEFLPSVTISNQQKAYKMDGFLTPSRLRLGCRGQYYPGLTCCPGDHGREGFFHAKPGRWEGWGMATLGWSKSWEYWSCLAEWYQFLKRAQTCFVAIRGRFIPYANHDSSEIMILIIHPDDLASKKTL